MQNAPMLIHRRINDRAGGAAIFRLHVEDLIVNADVGVNSGTHRLPIPSPGAQRSAAANKFLGSSFDRCTFERYYSSAFKMNSNYLDNYGPLLLMFILAGGL